MESIEPPSGCAHPFAYYFQATARQNRESQDQQSRFQKASQLLEADVTAAGGISIQSLMQGWLALLAEVIRNGECENQVTDLERRLNECEVESLATKFREKLDLFKPTRSLTDTEVAVDDIFLL